MREYTKKEKLQNWLYYNKIWLAVGAVLIWIIGSMLWNILGIGKVKPDYHIAYMGSVRLPDSTVEALENALASFGEDVNGDGRVCVTLTQHVFGNNGSMDNMMYGYASEVTILADISEGESTFFLLENPVDFQLSFQVLAHPDGSIPADDDYEAMDKVYQWKNCPALASLDLGSYADSYLDLTDTGNNQDLLSGLYLGRRYFFDPEQQKHPEADNAFWLAITEGATR